MNWFVGRGATVGFVLALCMLVASAALAYRNIESIYENEALVIHTHEVLDSLRRVMTSITDAETGQRGYIITGLDEYLRPYERALADIDSEVDRVEQLTADNPEQAARLKELQTALDERLKSLAEGIETRREAGLEAGRDYVLEGRGKKQMAIIRAAIAKMIETETALLSIRGSDSQTTYGTAIFTTAVTTVVGLAMIATAYFLTARELVNRRRMTAELECRVAERTQELNLANQSLRMSNRELEQFASVASHDLQEPLRKIEAFGDRLKTRCTESLDEQGRDYLERVLVSASRMRNLISDLLNFSRVTTRAQPFERLDLNRTAQEVVSDLEGRLQQVNGRIEVGRLPTIDADPLQIRQLLQNLIGNALKFHRPEIPPLVKVAATIVENGPQSKTCRLTIADNGIGFEEVYLDRIFDVFQRLHGRNEYEGTGMGLAICRKITERHRGTITAKSQLGSGATFIVELPVEQPKE